MWCVSVENIKRSEMVPNIQEECKTKPEEEVKMDEELAKSRLEELKSILGLNGDSLFVILLHGIVRSVLEESKVRLAEEMVSFRKSIAERLSSMVKFSILKKIKQMLKEKKSIVVI